MTHGSAHRRRHALCRFFHSCPDGQVARSSLLSVVGHYTILRTSMAENKARPVSSSAFSTHGEMPLAVPRFFLSHAESAEDAEIGHNGRAGRPAPPPRTAMRFMGACPHAPPPWTERRGGTPRPTEMALQPPFYTQRRMRTSALPMKCRARETCLRSGLSVDEAGGEGGEEIDGAGEAVQGGDGGGGFRLDARLDLCARED